MCVFVFLRTSGCQPVCDCVCVWGVHLCLGLVSVCSYVPVLVFRYHLVWCTLVLTVVSVYQRVPGSVLLCVSVCPSAPVGTGVHVGMATCLRLTGFVRDPVWMAGRRSLRICIPLFPSDHRQGACPQVSTPPPASRGPECGCFPPSPALGHGASPVAQDWRVGVCKHLGGSTQQPPTLSLISLQARLAIPLFWG